MTRSKLLNLPNLSLNGPFTPFTPSSNLQLPNMAKRLLATKATPLPKQQTSPEEEKSALEVHDFFGVHKLFTVKDLFDARVHLGHTVRSLEPTMQQFVYGTRFNQCIIDLDQTAELLRHALNFTAHIAYAGGIVMFVCRQPHLVHLVDKTAMECGEYSYTRIWNSKVFCASTLTFKQEIRLPDLVVMVHTKDSHQYGDHRAIIDAAKVSIPTVGIVDTDCNPNIITFPVPGNDDTLESVQLYLDLFKKTILLAKQKRKESSME